MVCSILKLDIRTFEKDPIQNCTKIWSCGYPKRLFAKKWLSAPGYHEIFQSDLKQDMIELADSGNREDYWKRILRKPISNIMKEDELFGESIEKTFKQYRFISNSYSTRGRVINWFTTRGL